MITLYGIIADRDNAQIITMLSIALLCFVYIVHLWKISGLTGKKFSTWEWAKIYVLGIIIFLSCVCSFAKVFFPDNADRLMSLLYISSFIDNVTRPYQTLLLKMVRFFM